MQRAAGWFVLGAVVALGLAGCSSPFSIVPWSLLVLGLALASSCRGDPERCCKNGRIATCSCPRNTFCNYGDYLDCGDGTCSLHDDCKRPDAGASDGAAPDAGTFDPCCVGGRVTTCFCPASVACNYGWFTDCGDGTCSPDPSLDGGVCPRDGGVDAGDASAPFEASLRDSP